MTRRVAVPGASGFIGSQIVPLLEDKGYELTLIGRDKYKLTALFPGRPAFDYSELDIALTQVDAILHLAVLNNNAVATSKEFESANIDCLNRLF
ncbi:NAD-dependent epimerase/dehydratase family protein [Ahrensia marina]|uniref:NAD-dependent epimerase/dehydratase domain-containing protein n=1 Tax=Ahrensia marina TaxID=1514904 RepID=A0A0N0VLF8_9HYPH|nr:NAD-dependent epimerase/dehydratase family protein [Ahrensia marina]KPB01218.1 hypothetical protein SU32_10075 [Ahrensia marina]